MRKKFVYDVYIGETQHGREDFTTNGNFDLKKCSTFLSILRAQHPHESVFLFDPIEELKIIQKKDDPTGIASWPIKKTHQYPCQAWLEERSCAKCRQIADEKAYFTPEERRQARLKILEN